MARINLEDSIFKDLRFQELMIRAGSRHTAKGMIWELWALAQEYWFPKRQYIPIEKIQEAGLQAVLDVGLAIPKDGGYFAVGTEKAFDWLFQKQLAGSKGGQAAATKRAAGAKRTKASEQRGVPSLLSSLSSSLSSPNSELSSQFIAGASETGPTPVIDQDSSSPTAKTWRAYKAAYEKRHGTAPPWNAKIAGQLRSLVSRIPAHEAPDVAAFYLTHSAYRYVNAMHPVGLLLMDAEKLHTEWVTGMRMTSQKAKGAELHDSNTQAVKDYLAGKVSL